MRMKTTSRTAALIASLSLALLSTLSHAGTDCEAKAIDKNGKPLAGAAKT